MLRALIFDVDGTLADTEEAHREAFNQVFAQAGLPWCWDIPTYAQLLRVTGGKERIQHFAKSLADAPGPSMLDALAGHLHLQKNAVYAEKVRQGEVHLRPGVQRLIDAALRHGVQLAIATTTSASNVAALLQATLGAGWQRIFAVVEDASTAPTKKPHPMAYTNALARLQLSAAQCVALEDSSNGLQAALAADLATVITRNAYTEDHNFSGALRVLPNLAQVSLDDLAGWLDGAAPALIHPPRAA